MPSDIFYPQDPTPWSGDQFVNTTHPGGAGDVFFDVKTPYGQDTIWDILNTFDQDTSWDILNSFEQDTVWDILNTYYQATSWDIINEFLRTTAWHIFPETIEYILKFVLAEIQTTFITNLIASDFEANEITSVFAPSAVIEDNVLAVESQLQQTVYLKLIQTSFTLKNQIQINFTPTRVINDQYDTPEY